MPRVLIFVVAYNAESTLTEVIHRIPREIFDRYDAEILVIDDASSDETFAVGDGLKAQFPELQITILRNPKNLGYGGNQKLGYQYAIREGFDQVVLLHGDGQYAPEEMPRLLNHLVEENCDAVFGSRMLEPKSAIKGGMPLYKYIGNRILTSFQNAVTGLKLSEWHSGYRLYSVAALKTIPFDRNSNDFDFDTHIILQFAMAGYQIDELPIPTYYGDEVCHVNGLKYAAQVIWSTMLAKLSRLGVLYNPRFETTCIRSPYQSKFGFASSHRFALDAVVPNERVLILGCGPIETTLPFSARTEKLFLIDQQISGNHLMLTRDAYEADLNEIKEDDLGQEPFDCILIMDVIEHLQDPETFMSKLRSFKQCRNSRVIMTTPNVAFLPVRLMFALGQFNYGERGILDRTHTRLFTFASFRRLLSQQGFERKKMRGVPAPFPLALGNNVFSRFLVKMNQWAIAILPTLFSYQIYCEAKPLPTVDQLLKSTETHSSQLRELVSA